MISDERLDRIEAEALEEIERRKWATFEVQDVLDLVAEVRALWDQAS